MSSNVVIHWFRQDLRLSDNPALLKAASQGKVLAVYILDDKNSGKDAMGAASRLWLHRSLTALNESLGGKLNFYSGDAVKIIDILVKNHQAKAVYWNRCYENWRIKRDGLIKENLKKDGITGESFNASLL
ncbi:MAG: deoxyribodipyrimidine photo-lyase, partial [Pseudomonadota bacterium]